MPNELILDAKQFIDMVGAWEDGGVYRVELTITQVSNDGKKFKATVNEVLDYGDAEAEVEEEPVATPPAPPRKPPVKTAPYPPAEE